MLKETQIKQMRIFFESHLIDKRITKQLLADFRQIMNLFDGANPYYSKLGLSFNEKAWKRQNQIEKFLSTNFPDSIIDEFNVDVPIPQYQPKYAESNSGNLLHDIMRSWANHTEEQKQESHYISKHKKEYLKYLFFCLENYGLHPSIFERGDSFKRYNICIELSEDIDCDNLRILIPENELLEEFINPFFSNDRILLNGEIIDSKSIKKINVSSTFLKDEELILFTNKYGIRWNKNPTVDQKYRFHLRCNDETNKFLKGKKYRSGRRSFIDFSETELYVSKDRIAELKLIDSPNFDLSKLLKLCEELNVAAGNNLHFAVLFLVRAIIDHIPPIFGKKNYEHVASDFTGGSSTKKILLNLQQSFKNIAHNGIHSQIKQKVILPNNIQINFRNDLDILLGEVIKELHQ